MLRLDKEETPTNEEVTACKQTLHTIRSVFIINPQKEIRAILTYPMETGRNIDEIIRMIDSLQARADHGHRIVTPANWQPVSHSSLSQLDFRED
jgi:alkyl hydroperoxide reductase subunit AhpC